MINQLYPVINGVDPSWADIKCTATPDGAPLIAMEDVASIDCGSSVEVGYRKGTSGGRVMGRTTGEKTDEFSWSLYRVGFDKLLRGLMALAPARNDQRAVSHVAFGITVQHTPYGVDSIFEYRAKGARLIGMNFSHAEGVDADKVEVPLSIIELAYFIDGQEVVLL